MTRRPKAQLVAASLTFLAAPLRVENAPGEMAVTNMTSGEPFLHVVICYCERTRPGQTGTPTKLKAIEIGKLAPL
jgi:hypothetical protein